MARQGFILLYPDTATETLFSNLLGRLDSHRRKDVRDAILSLEEDPRPQGKGNPHYRELNAEALKVFLRILPGIPVEKGQPSAYLDYLYAKHRITIRGITVAYAIDDGKKYVWLMGIRKAL